MAINFQATLAILKPDIAANPRIVQQIEKIALAKKFYIVKKKYVRWNKINAQQFYMQHREKFFFERLVGFMSSGPICALVLAKQNAIQDWRQLLGPTKVYKARFSHPNTVRGHFGLTDTRNSVHGSDSLQSVKDELSQFFPKFDLVFWLKNEGKLFERGLVTFDEQTGLHQPLDSGYCDSITDVQKPEGLKLSEIGSPDAWSRFYTGRDEPIDWFVEYEQLQSQLERVLQENLDYRVVVDVGCGTSRLGPKLADHNPKLNIYCIDSALECLQTLGSDYCSTNCTFAVSDVRKSLPFQTDSVDLIIDKGTSDAIARHEDGALNVKSMLAEAKRVLHADGTLLQITTEPPENKVQEVKLVDEDAKVSFTKLAATSNNLEVFVYRVNFQRPAQQRPLVNRPSDLTSGQPTSKV